MQTNTEVSQVKRGVGLIGSTEPRIHTPLLNCASKAQEVADLAERIGLPLIAWQRWVLDDLLSVDDEGNFKKKTALILVARQNGKTHLARMLILAHLFLWGSKNVLGMSSNRNMALDTFRQVAWTIDEGQAFARIKAELEYLGYSIKYQILSPHTHANIPALRKRLFIVGFRSKEECEAFTFPEEIPLTKSVFDFLYDEVEDKFYFKADAVHFETTAPAQHGKVYQLRRTYLRENKNNLLPTITHTIGTGGNNNVPVIRDYKGVRKITPEELFRFQGANNFITPSAVSTAYQQVGNAVCVDVVERIAKNIKKVIERPLTSR